VSRKADPTFGVTYRLTRRHKDIKINELKKICDFKYFISRFIFVLLYSECLRTLVVKLVT
ncbi:MAG: hypothetical protein JXL67_05395, partial [Calditrichaeota bacterium]|nr:hypothetical protein [Calditrichota bacterium]